MSWNAPRILVLCLFLVATACGDGSSRTAGVGREGEDPPRDESEGIAEIERALDLPPDPGDAGKVTVVGVDANSTGVRDDVERFVAMTHWPERERIAILMDIARHKQTMLEHADDDVAAMVSEATDAMRSFDCLVESAGDDIAKARQWNAELNVATYNTLDRLKAYGVANGKLSGQAFESGDRSTLEAHCAALVGAM